MTQTWLVTGAGGFLGANTAAFLKGQVRLVGQTRTAQSTSLYDEMHALDLRDAGAIVNLVRRVKPTVILHCAAISGHETAAQDPEQARLVNTVATQVLAESAAEVGARMVHISTDAVFGGTLGNYRESDPVEPFSVYGETKLAGEEAVRAALEDHLIVRTNFFGWSETGSKSVLEFFVNALRSGEAVRGYPDFVVTSIYVQSLVEAIWQLGERNISGTVHVASCDALSKFDFGIAVAKQFDLNPTLIAPLGAAPGSHSTSRSRDLSLNTDLVASLLRQPLPSQAAGLLRASIEEQSIGSLVRTDLIR